MKQSELPLEVLGLISPFFSWVEGGGPLAFDETKSSTQNGLTLARERAWLRRELPTYSLDNLDDIISLARGPMGRAGPAAKMHGLAPLSSPPGYDLVDVLRDLSRRYLQWVGNQPAVRSGRMVEFHELGLRLPPAHILGFFHGDAVVRGMLTQKQALKLSARLSNLNTALHGMKLVTDQGLSETHLHLKGVPNVDEVIGNRLFQGSGTFSHGGFSDPNDRMLALSRIAFRLVVAGLIYAGHETAFEFPYFPAISALDRLYLAATPRDRMRKAALLKEAMDVLCKQIFSHFPGHQTRGNETLTGLLTLLAPGRMNPGEKPRGQGLQPGIGEKFRILEKTCLQALITLIRSYENRERIYGNIHNPTMTASHQGKLVREFLHEAYFRLLLLHTHHWTKGVHSGNTTGLRQFVEFYYARQRKDFKAPGLDVNGLILERLAQAPALEYIEGRVTPPERGLDELLPWVAGFAKQVLTGKLKKFGLIVHFIKEEQAPSRHRRTAAGNGRPAVRFRYIRNRLRRKARQLFHLLKTHHPVVPFIVGIDAAHLELAVPPEVFAPAFRFLREYPLQPRKQTFFDPQEKTFEGLQALVHQKRLGMTYHVGEDFRHLLSGMRAIFEVIEFLKPLPGDRLGHAIALALNPERWAEHIGYLAVLPQQEWLDTLVWLHHFMGPGDDLLGDLEVEDQIQRYCREIYKPWIFTGTQEKSGAAKAPPGRVSDWSPPSLYDAWRLRQLDPASLNLDDLLKGKHSVRGSDGFGLADKRWARVQIKALNEVDRNIGSDAAYHLLKLYWYDRDSRGKGAKMTRIDMSGKKAIWLRVCRRAQEKLKALVIEKQLVVEVNPSSNRIIGHMKCYAEHPIFDLTLDDNHNLKRDIRVTVNTDNPGVCNTSLAHEFYLLGETLLDRGVAEPKVMVWLEWLRENGKHFSFLQQLPSSDDPHFRRQLEKIVTQNHRLIDRLEGKRSARRPSQTLPGEPSPTRQELKFLMEQNRKLMDRLASQEKSTPLSKFH